MVKLTKREIEDFLELISHVRTDISFGEGGTFNKWEDGSFDEKAVKKVQRAIDRLKIIMVNGA